MTAIIVACLGSFRQLFVIQDKRSHTHPTTKSPRSSISRKIALPRFQLSYSLRHKPIPLLPTQQSSTVDLPRVSSSSLPQRELARKYESKLEQQIGTDTQLTNTATNDSSMDAFGGNVREEDIAIIPPVRLESDIETKLKLVSTERS